MSEKSESVPADQPTAGEDSPDSDCEYVDAKEAADADAAAAGVHDFNRPSDWEKKDRSDKEGEADKDSEVEKDSEADRVTDSLGFSPGSADFVDEELLQRWETELSEEEKSGKLEEAREMKRRGNELYKEGRHLDACDAYTAGLRLCPLAHTKDRAILYANRAVMKKNLGLPDQAISNCSKALELDPAYLKAVVRRAQLYEETDKLDESLKDFQRVLELDPANCEAHEAVRRLPARIEERNERLKQEMFDNLKKLGNMVLNPFGLTTENFKMEQDPSTGGYSVKFQQN